MNIASKKIDMASKFYKQNSPGGKGASPKYKQKGGPGEGPSPKFKQAGARAGHNKFWAPDQAHGEEPPKPKYGMTKNKLAQKMINGSSKPKQKGKMSLNKASGKNEGEKMYLGKDEHNRA